MDPIHPIVPTPPSIAPVTPAPLAARIERDGARSSGEDQRRKRRRQPSEEPEGDAFTGEDGLTHIDLTA